MRSPDRRREAGFTLIELMIVVAIMGIMGDTMARVLKIDVRGIMEAEASLGQMEQARRASSALVRDLHAARSVEPVPARLGGPSALRITGLDGRKVEYVLVKGVLSRRASAAGKPAEVRTLARDVREVRLTCLRAGSRVSYVGWQFQFAKQPGGVFAAAAALPR